MTKEQTLGLPFYPEECGSAIECVTKKQALEAMDIWALNFYEWVLKNKNDVEEKEGRKLSPKELYDIFSK